MSSLFLALVLVLRGMLRAALSRKEGSGTWRLQGRHVQGRFRQSHADAQQVSHSDLNMTSSCDETAGTTAQVPKCVMPQKAPENFPQYICSKSNDLQCTPRPSVVCSGEFDLT
jgi:hypothetical protein